jgi:hypothetical protein
VLTIYQKVQVILGSLVIAGFGLSLLSRRFPDVAWLQAFRFRMPQPSAAQRAVLRRRANAHAGIEMILLGVCLPLGYVALTVMFFHSFTAMGVVAVLAGSALCIALGITAIRRSRRG